MGERAGTPGAALLVRRLSRAGEWTLVICVVCVVFALMLAMAGSKEGMDWSYRRMASELCRVPGTSGVDMNVSLYYMEKHPKVQPGQVGLSEKWAWYRSQLDGYTPAELKAAGCSEEEVERREARQAQQQPQTSEGVRSAGVGTTQNGASGKGDGGCSADPRAVFSVGQRLSGAEVRRRLELHCPGVELQGAVAMVVHKGERLRVELQEVQPLADGYFTVKQITKAD
jgi:hypothetical protein